MRPPIRVRTGLFFLMIILSVQVPSRADDFRNRADILVENLVRENFGAVVASFTPWLAGQHPVDELERVWFNTVGRYGPYQEHHFGEVIEKDTTISYLYVIEFEFATFVAVAAYNSRGEVMAFILQPPEGKPIFVQPSWIVPDYVAVEAPVYQIPPYVDTSLFNEVEFVMKGGTPIPATMTVAITDELNPVVLLFHGFGPTDRDETVGSLKPLRDIAWGLASRGVASIRFDCRAYTQPPDSVAAYNLNQYMLDDIAALLAYIRLESAIFDTTRIFIAAHGLGGMAAPLAALNDGGLAGLILLSVPARPFAEMLMETVRNDLKADDKSSKSDRKMLEEISGILERLENRTLPSDEMILFAPARVWYDLMDNNHLKIIKRLNSPILIVQSGRDFKASEADSKIWDKTLAGLQSVTLKKYHNLNHFFQPGLGPADKTDYMSNSAPVDRQVVEDMAAWIKSR